MHANWLSKKSSIFFVKQGKYFNGQSSGLKHQVPNSKFWQSRGPRWRTDWSVCIVENHIILTASEMYTCASYILKLYFHVFLIKWKLFLIKREHDNCFFFFLKRPLIVDISLICFVWVSWKKKSLDVLDSQKQHNE